jgi:hypothetical protein
MNNISAFHSMLDVYKCKNFSLFFEGFLQIVI